MTIRVKINGIELTFEQRQKILKAIKDIISEGVDLENINDTPPVNTLDIELKPSIRVDLDKEKALRFCKAWNVEFVGYDEFGVWYRYPEQDQSRASRMIWFGVLNILADYDAVAE